MKLKYFDSLTDVTTYAADEIIAEMSDDLERMSSTQDYLYSDERAGGNGSHGWMISALPGH